MNLTPQAHLTRRLLLALAGALAMTPAAWSQTAQTDETKAKADAAAANAPAVESNKPADDKVTLTPFVVTTSKDSGYYAENTLAGSRLNSNLRDLAASITVVTKQQLDDTGALDINDVFLYEANTEGASTYTPVALNRSNLTDNIGGYSGDDGSSFGIATANRVRGLGRVDTAQNNYPTIARLAFDSYNTNSVEISRGPNSMLFGTGAPAGIVNQSSATAVLGRQSTEVQLRGGSFGAWRVSANANIPLGDKLAIFIAGLYDSRGFERKPSSDIYRRQYAAITWQPFKKTIITGNYEHYDNYNNRPNFLPPQDRVTPWLNAGKPGWDPTTQLVTFANGSVKGPYLNSTLDARYVPGVTPSADANLTTTGQPFFIDGLGFLAGRQTLYFDDGNLIAFWVNAGSSGGNTSTGLPADAGRTQAQRVIVASRYTLSSAPLVPIPPASTGANAYGAWVLPHLTNQSIYDWTQYNISGANYGTQQANTMNVDLQQQILPGLNFTAGWFRQTFDEWTHYGLGQANQAPRLYVDTNTKNLDGTPNPHFGSPFVFDSQEDSFHLPETNDNLRAMLSYEVDFTSHEGWTRFLGRHRFLGLASSQDQWRNNLRYRLSYKGGDSRFLPTAAALAAAGSGRQSWGLNAANIQRYYYLSDGNTSGVVTKGLIAPGDPGFGGVSNGSLRLFDFPSGNWQNQNMDFDLNLIYAGANYGVSTRKTRSQSFAWQGYLWDERILPTVGWRKDSLKLQAYLQGTLTNADLYSGGYGVDGQWNHLGNEFPFEGTTTTKGVVVRPFKGWSSIDRRAREGSFIADVLEGLQFHYNTSDNFNAPGSVTVDFFNKVLPVPAGQGKDYGFGLSMFNNKLVMRLNWYEATNQNALSNAANTVVGRVQRIDTASTHRWAEYVVRIRSGQNPTTENDFDNNTTHPLSAAQQAAITSLMWGSFSLADYNWPNNYVGTVNSTENNLSKGKELQLTYNPLPNWTMKVTGAQNRASYNAVGKELQDWLAFRKPVWMSLTAPDLPNEITRFDGNKLLLSNFWNGYGFTQGYPQGTASAFNDAPSNTAGGTGTPSSTYSSIVEAVYFPVLAKQGQQSDNLRQYSVNFSTNYTFNKGRWKGFSIGGSYRWQDKAIAGYQSLLDPTTYAHPNATTTQIIFPDLNKPIYTPPITAVDLWLAYTRKIFSDKVRLKVQLNVRDALESGGLQAVVFNQDGSPAQYRIKDPRSWFVTTTFDF